MSPMNVPSPMTRMEARMPMSIVTWVPHQSRGNTSRPIWSVPGHTGPVGGSGGGGLPAAGGRGVEEVVVSVRRGAVVVVRAAEELVRVPEETRGREERRAHGHEDEDEEEAEANNPEPALAE